MNMITLDQNDIAYLNGFAAEDAQMIREGFPIGAFKPRHLKKAMKKAQVGQSLMPREIYWLMGDGEPMYDMDGSYYHAPMPECGGMGYPEPEGGFPEFDGYAESSVYGEGANR